MEFHKKIIIILYTIRMGQTLDDECLQTALCEVEAVLNARPITVTSGDSKNPEPLTPNHLLLLKGKPMLPPGLFSKQDRYSRRKWKQVQYLSDLFWKRWTWEYLPRMQERQKWNEVKRNLKPGDIVLIIDETSPRKLLAYGTYHGNLSRCKGLCTSWQSENSDKHLGKTYYQAVSSQRHVLTDHLTDPTD